VQLRIAFHPRAADDAATIEGWWRSNRPAALELFVQELEATLALVADAPTLGGLAERTMTAFARCGAF
jgi:plasmid stabilization system protein ParE